VVNLTLRRLLFLVALVSTFASGFRARADEASDARDAREHYLKGTKAYELGSYDEAIAEYAAAYRFRDDPALLYNLGQANRLANHPAEALRFYRMFLLKAPKSAVRREVQDKVTELQKLVDEAKKAAAAQPEATPTAAAPAEKLAPVPPPTSAQPPPSTAQEQRPKRELSVAERAARTKIIAGGVTAGGGVLLIVGGVIAGVLAKQAGDNLTHLNQTHQPFDYDLEQSGKRDQIIAGVLLGVGGAAVAAGATLAVLGARKLRRERSVVLAPLINRNLAGVAWAGSF